MRLMRKIRTMTLVAGAGAAAAYFLDPENGPERRRRVVSMADEARRNLEHARGAASSTTSEDGDESHEGLPTTGMVADVRSEVEAEAPPLSASDTRMAETRSAAPAPG